MDTLGTDVLPVSACPQALSISTARLAQVQVYLYVGTAAGWVLLFIVFL